MTKRKKTVHVPIEDDDRREDETPRAGDAERPAADAAGAPGSGPQAGSRPGADAGAGSRTNDAELEAEEIREDIAETEVEAEGLVGHLQRLQAEFENYKRRTTREKQEIGGFAQAMLIEKLLPALDDLDRAAESAGEEDTATVQGFLLVRDKLRRALTEAGLERITAVGETFDPNLHEALLTEPVEDHRAGQVLEELVAGYTFKGNVVRHARVKVGMAGD
jgi:molecular chaperone GrpE